MERTKGRMTEGQKDKTSRGTEDRTGPKVEQDKLSNRPKDRNGQEAETGRIDLKLILFHSNYFFICVWYVHIVIIIILCINEI